MTDEISSTNIFDQLLTPIGTGDGVGEWVRYDPVYGQIRDFRREEDDGMNREPWEGELKHANWQEVERLSKDLLSTKSKDLQLVLWFLEARFHLYGIADWQNIADFLLKYIQKFWQNTHPQISEDPTQEFRTHLIEAFLRSFCERMVLEPIVELSQFFSSAITLAKCFEASNLEKNAKRGGSAADFFQKAIVNGLVVMDRIRNALREVDQEKGQEKVALIKSTIDSMKAMDGILEQEIGNDSPRFDEIVNLLEELKGLYSLCQKVNYEKAPDKLDTKTSAILAEQEGNQKEESKNEGNVINDRAGVYNALRQLGEFLMTLEPHSPAPALVKLVATWENKNLSQILADLQTSSLEVRLFINMLAKATNLENSLPLPINQPNKQESKDLPNLF